MTLGLVGFLRWIRWLLSILCYSYNGTYEQWKRDNDRPEFEITHESESFYNSVYLADYVSQTAQWDKEEKNRVTYEKLMNFGRFLSMMWGLGGNYNLNVRPLPIRSYSFRGIHLNSVDDVTGGLMAKYSGILRDASRFKGNYGLGKATHNEAMELGRAWVGRNYSISTNGRFYSSSNGLRQFQIPNYKPIRQSYHSNFYWRNSGQIQWQSNGHLDITN